MLRIVAAFSIFILGVVLAISAAAKVPAEGHTWPDTWPLFAFGVAVSIAGLVGWWKAVSSQRNDVAGGSKSVETLFGYVRDARRETAAIAADWQQLDGRSVRPRIDRLLLDYITPFVEHRDLVIQRYGMRRGAELVLTLAQAERNLNRTWSAAADGCMPEAETSLAVALDSMDDLVASIESLH